MKKETNVNLYMYSTMRTKSYGSVMYTPENIEELRDIISQLKGNCYILAAGSNIVFGSYVEKPIVNLMELNKEMYFLNNGILKVGCSVRIQKLINYAMENSLGGFEYLYSLPASVGGVVYMNAGRGMIHNQQVSDWIDTIEYLDLDDMVIKEKTKVTEEWSYRCSPFQKMNAIILSVNFKMKHFPKEQIAAKIKDRIDKVKKDQEGNKPSCGSVMHTCNKYVMFLFKGYRKGGAHYSKKVNNWISNDKNATGDDVVKLIEAPQKIHRLFKLPCVPEIRIFK